jgi:hypothetical protein
VVKKPVFTYEQHVEMATELQEMSNRLAFLAGESGAVPDVRGPLGQARAGIVKARGRLDSLLSADFPELFCAHVYYRNGITNFTRASVGICKCA